MTSGKAEVMNRTFHLVPRSDGLLGLQYKILGLIPISLGDLDFIGISRAAIAGHDTLVARAGSQELLIGEKFIPVPVSEKWLRRTGAYEIANAGEDTLLFDKIRLLYKEGFLVIAYNLPFMNNVPISHIISPISDTEAIILGLGSGMGETIRVIAIDGKERLHYSGYQLKVKAGE